MDSGATKHMTHHRATFDTYGVITPRNMHLGDDSVVEAVGAGLIVIKVPMRGCLKKITIKDALRVPKLQGKLLSISKLVANGVKVQFIVDGCVLRAPNRDFLAIAPCEGNLYQVTFTKLHEADATNVVQSSTKTRDVVFVVDGIIIGDGLELVPSGHSETPSLALVDESSKSPPSDDYDGSMKTKERSNVEERGVPPSSIPSAKDGDFGCL